MQPAPKLGMVNMFKTFYAPQFKALFIKIYDYEGSVVARALVEVMKEMPRAQIVSLAYVAIDIQEVGSASLQDSDAALQFQLFNQLKDLGADPSSIQLVCILDPANSNNELILERLNRVKPFYKGIPEHASAFYSWHEAMDQIGAPHNYIVEYPN